MPTQTEGDPSEEAARSARAARIRAQLGGRQSIASVLGEEMSQLSIGSSWEGISPSATGAGSSGGAVPPASAHPSYGALTTPRVLPSFSGAPRPASAGGVQAGGGSFPLPLRELAVRCNRRFLPLKVRNLHLS
jgi:hypothetical protein